MPSTRQRRTSERVDLEAYRSDPNDHLLACMHVATYDFARPWVSGRTVLDFGCGTGYGAHRLAEAATSITGVDVSAGAIERATRDEAAPNVTFAHIEPIEKQPLPFGDDQFDTVLSFQVIEHVPDVGRYLREIRRVLRAGGTFVCATPDRRVRLSPGQRPWNVHHRTEFTPDEMRELMRSVFEDVTVHRMVSDPPELLDLELDRFARARRLTRPFTFPRSPEWWRRAGLYGMKAANRVLEARRKVDATPDPTVSSEAIHVVAGTDPSPNVVTVAR